MYKCWVIENADGSVYVVHPIMKAKHNDESFDEFYQRMLAKTLEACPHLQGKPIHEVNSSTLPQDRRDRHAWRVRNGVLVVDNTVPKPITKNDRIKNAKTFDELKDAILGN